MNKTEALKALEAELINATPGTTLHVILSVLLAGLTPDTGALTSDEEAVKAESEDK